MTQMTDAEQVLQQWIDEEKNIRARMITPGLADMADVMSKTGLQLIEDMFAGNTPPPNITQPLDFLMMHVKQGYVVFQGTPQESFYNPMGTIHGGWFATLLDSAMGCAVHTMMPIGRAYTTAELSVNMVKAITTKVKSVRVIGEVVHCGRQLATAQARLVGSDGTLYAHATSTCLVFDMPKMEKK